MELKQFYHFGDYLSELMWTVDLLSDHSFKLLLVPAIFAFVAVQLAFVAGELKAVDVELFHDLHLVKLKSLPDAQEKFSAMLVFHLFSIISPFHI